MSGPTIVTFLFDLGSRERGSGRPAISSYLERGEFLLGAEADLVCFAEPGVAELVREARDRHGLSDRTAIVTRTLEELHRYALLEEAVRARSMHPLLNGSRLTDTPLAALLGWSKFDLLAEAIDVNSFGASHFIWLDFGIGHAARTGNVTEDGVFGHLPDGVRLLQMRPLDRDLLLDRAHHLQYRRGYVAGGLISGRGARLHEAIAVIDRVLQDAVRDGFAPLDEHLLDAAICQAPKLFDLYHGDLESIFDNYRRPRGGALNLLDQLRIWRSRSEFEPAGLLAARIIESVGTGSFECEPAVLAQLVEECFIASYYAGGDERTQARACAALYAERCHLDPDFRDEFLRHEIRVRANLGFVGQAI